ncbi:beta-N-acetylhexosaminidase [Antarcticibacterium sp. 1MA-6-2]|uniref:beta-N-acetylhexosaminidase n=1 Tax=Antarcticibacterium sp. 1MA-6-2 TaxID=2908210 RepID=UPI0021048569|nr:beta-N-acetylhexosaminidase [Antarcticibacterium sp. 1MA-6-2]
MKRKTKFYIISILVAAFFSSCANIQKSENIAAEGNPPSLIPAPQSLEWGDNMFRVPQENIICFNTGSETAAAWLQELLDSANKEVTITSGDACGNWNLTLDSQLEDELGEEGYTLNITNEIVEIKGATEAGLFYAVQTLRQLFPSEMEQGQYTGEDIFLRQVSITDYPEYPWRGTMVDVARSFFGLEYLKKHVDRMALYKLNRLHLHLSDDQGWRIEIKSWPKLTEVGSKGSVTGGRSGFLSQEEYKELQDYALSRNIIIVPEVDMPGHIYAALVSYPELNCPENSNIEPKLATPPGLYSGYEVGWSRFCLAQPETYDFVSDVIGELAEITKGPWIHIGGDEIEDPLYETFVVKADSIVQHHGKTAIGWEEVTKAPVSSSMISQEWTGKTESVVDVKKIVSICTNFYFDHANFPGQEGTLNWCKEDGVSLENAYSFMNDDPNVLGVEAIGMDRARLK